MTSVSVTRCRELLVDELAELLTESEAASFQFVHRLATEWASGANRFAEAGEVLLEARSNGRLIGICGLNRDPYAASERIGRVRHLYVLASFRCQGVGRRLVAEIVAAARGTFDRLHLRTDTEQAARFYQALGFHVCSDVPACTHVLQLATRSDPADCEGRWGVRRPMLK